MRIMVLLIVSLMHMSISIAAVRYQVPQRVPALCMHGKHIYFTNKSLIPKQCTLRAKICWALTSLGCLITATSTTVGSVMIGTDLIGNNLMSVNRKLIGGFVIGTGSALGLSLAGLSFRAAIDQTDTNHNYEISPTINLTNNDINPYHEWILQDCKSLLSEYDPLESLPYEDDLNDVYSSMRDYTPSRSKQSTLSLPKKKLAIALNIIINQRHGGLLSGTIKFNKNRMKSVILYCGDRTVIEDALARTYFTYYFQNTQGDTFLDLSDKRVTRTIQDSIGRIKELCFQYISHP